jgi:Na+-transporting NADH:ubiquinone oxidoreductase subunit C
MKNESITKTFAVATALCVVCAIIVSLSDVMLKETQLRNKALDKQVNILSAAGLVEPGAKVSAEEAASLFANAETVVVDLTTGDVVDLDPAIVESDKTNLLELAGEDDVAGIKTINKYAVVYVFKDEQGAIKTVVLPIVGQGLWSTLHGFLALNGDLKTVAHIVFYDHGETPGLGGEISNPVWTKNWEGKTAVDESGNPVIHVVKGSAENAENPANAVDGISGATLTGKGVTNTVTFWLDYKGYRPFLSRLRNGEPLASTSSETSPADANEN